jgi:hypothetical protein
MTDWRPYKIGQDWVVFNDGRCRRPYEYALGKDGTILRFWNEASAQLKADALNRRLSR